MELKFYYLIEDKIALVENVEYKTRCGGIKIKTNQGQISIGMNHGHELKMTFVKKKELKMTSITNLPLAPLMLGNICVSSSLTTIFFY